MKTIVLVFSILNLWIQLARSVETLVFDASPTPGVTYKLLWGTNSTLINGSIAIGTNRIVLLDSGPWGRVFVGVIAISTSGIDSLVSNVIAITNQPYAPLQMRALHKFGDITLEASDDMINWEPVATIRQGDPPVNVAPKVRQFFRVSLPPMPGLVAASVKPVAPVLQLHKQRGMR